MMCPKSPNFERVRQSQNMPNIKRQRLETVVFRPQKIRQARADSSSEVLVISDDTKAVVSTICTTTSGTKCLKSPIFKRALQSHCMSNIKRRRLGTVELQSSKLLNTRDDSNLDLLVVSKDMNTVVSAMNTASKMAWASAKSVENWTGESENNKLIIIALRARCGVLEKQLQKTTSENKYLANRLVMITSRTIVDDIAVHPTNMSSAANTQWVS